MPARGYRLVEHWAAGDDYTRDRRDLWLLEADDIWMTTWMIEFRRGGLGNAIERQTYENEEAARWALAAKMEQERNLPGCGEWERVP